MKIYSIKRYLNDKSFLRLVLRKMYYFSYELEFVILKLGRKLKLKSKYDDIKKFKNIHNGERCVIVATGPSLQIKDLEKIKDEYTFSMNSIVMAYGETMWRPTYYGVQDYSVYEQIKNYIKEDVAKNIFISDFLNRRIKKKDAVVFPLTLMGHPTQTNNKYKTKFSNDCHRVVYDGFSISYSLLQMAVYMGFKEIYLLGFDCNYCNEKKHFKDYESSDPTRSTITERLIIAYTVAQKYCANNGIKVYNATRGGMLEVFERVNFDEVF